MDTDSFELSVSTEDIITVLKNPEDLLDLSILSENHELSKIKTKKFLEKSR